MSEPIADETEDIEAMATVAELETRLNALEDRVNDIEDSTTEPVKSEENPPQGVYVPAPPEGMAYAFCVHCGVLCTVRENQAKGIELFTCPCCHNHNESTPPHIVPA